MGTEQPARKEKTDILQTYVSYIECKVYVDSILNETSGNSSHITVYVQWRENKKITSCVHHNMVYTGSYLHDQLSHDQYIILIMRVPNFP